MVLTNILTLAVILLSIYWKLADTRTLTEKKKSYFQRNTLLPAFFSFTYFLLNYLSARFFPLPTSEVDILMTYSGVVVFFLGIFICVWARITMGKSWGTPAQNLKTQKKLITTGPFEFSRNPIYAGIILIMLGYGLAVQSYFTILVLIPMFYFRHFAIEEENILEKKFGKVYLEYKKKVPRFF